MRSVRIWISKHSSPADLMFGVGLIGIMITLLATIAHRLDGASAAAFLATFGALVSTATSIMNKQDEDKTKLPPTPPPPSRDEEEDTREPHRPRLLPPEE